MLNQVASLILGDLSAEFPSMSNTKLVLHSGRCCKIYVKKTLCLLEIVFGEDRKWGEREKGGHAVKGLGPPPREKVSLGESQSLKLRLLVDRNNLSALCLFFQILFCLYILLIETCEGVLLIQLKTLAWIQTARYAVLGCLWWWKGG